MTGYAMSNYFLARFIEENKLPAPKLKAVITSSEKLTKEMRETFRRVYNCETFDSYSGVEACGLISQCEKGKLHLSPDVAIVEIIKEDGSYAEPGESGEAICTGFLNFDQPLIRYRIGDILTLSNIQSCVCGRNMPVIDEIVGRIEDTVIGVDGREMVRFHGIFINIPEIIEGQIIQFDLSEFEINIVATQPLDQQHRDDIYKRMVSQLGNDINLKINEVKEIPRNANGKFKAVISHVKR
jgi:phenylacetate-CoA ligase